jgi:hypothetical protein
MLWLRLSRVEFGNIHKAALARKHLARGYDTRNTGFPRRFGKTALVLDFESQMRKQWHLLTAYILFMRHTNVFQISEAVAYSHIRVSFIAD